MTQKHIRTLAYSLLLALPLFFASCSTKNDVDAFKEAEYDLAGINEMNLNGINLLDKKSSSDFSFSEAAALFSAVSANNLNAKSSLGLRVTLPEGSKDRSMIVEQLKWQLLVDGKQTLSGLVSEPIELKDGLNTITVATPVKLTEDQGKVDLRNLMQLATLLNREGGDKPAVSLQIKPTIKTSIGPFELPSYISLTN